METDDEIYMADSYAEDGDTISQEEIRRLEDLEDEEAEAFAGNFSEADFAFSGTLYHLKLDYSNESFYASFAGDELARGTYVLVPTRYGRDLARVLGKVRAPVGVKPENIGVIERPATEQDRKKAENFRKEEEYVFGVFREKITAHHLDMKTISAHFLLDGSKILFFFSAENRVDFRNLVKDLSASLKGKEKGLERIELRQIGVRDESKITGGLGVCGRPYCCHSVSDHLRPVSIKMPKEQNLSINSLKISGQCGRLLCCLAYEYDWYVEARKKMPNPGVRVFYDGCMFRVSEVNPITERIRLIGEDERILEIPAFRMTLSGEKWRIVDG